MSANSFGRFFKITTFGESRSQGLGAVIDGCPAGIPLNCSDIQTFLNRRKPFSFSDNSTSKKFSTHRKEDDICNILSGIYENTTLGSPIAVLVKNEEISDKNYEDIKDIYRPGHADYAYFIKYGIRDYRGGGRASGRETIGRVIGGAVAKKILDVFAEKKGLNKIEIKTCAEEIAGIKLQIPIYENDSFPKDVFKRLSELSEEGNSAGCILTCRVLNVPEGLGSPVFYKLDAVLSQAIMSIGAVKGIEFGTGFYSAALTGKENNDTEKNHSGGISGGISAGNTPYNFGQKKSLCTISFRTAIKPPPSIQTLQNAFNCKGEKINLSVKGNHDVCLFPRIIPVIESMVYITLADELLASFSDRL